MDFSATFQEFFQQAVLFLPRLVAAIVIFVAALLLAGAAARSVQRAARVKIDDPETLQLLSRLTRWAVIGVGTLTALDQIFDVTSFLAGLGIAGLTVGFALQDIARNFVAGILLLIRQPFDIGDAVEAAGYAGTVLDVTTRDTTIKTWDGEVVIIPNIEVFGQPIINYSDLPTRRRTIRISVGCGEDVARAIHIFLETIRRVEGVLEDPAPTILLEDGLGEWAIPLVARFWVNQETHSILGVHSAVVGALKEAGEAQGIELPYPTQAVRLEGEWPVGAPQART